jgi:hypothetical protein
MEMMTGPWASGIIVGRIIIKPVQGWSWWREKIMAVMDYTTRDGLADYGFSIEFQPDSGWRVYIVFHPSEDNNESRNLPYQSIDYDGRRYVDWRAKLDSLGDARTVAALWAELAQRYQRTQGQRRATSAGPDRLGDAIGADRAGPGHQYGGSVIPHPSIAAKSSNDFQQRKQSGRGANEVA